MISSMTGFSAAKAHVPIGSVSVEVRTLNNRFLEIALRLPNNLNFLETSLRELIRKKINRGKVDLFLKWDPPPELASSIQLNLPVIQALLEQYHRLQRRLKIKDPLPLSQILQIPQCIISSMGDIREEEMEKCILPLVEKALDVLKKNRLREGNALKRALKVYIEDLEKQLREINKVKGEVIAVYRRKVRERLERLLDKRLESLNADRLEAEIAMMADKTDISEEIVRLESHLKEFLKVLSPNEPEPVGRHLDFVCQEIFREINTIGSKCRDMAIAKKVLDMKNTVEKVREQVQNIE